MRKRSLTLLFFALIIMSFSACSSRLWYESFREMERQHCYKIESQSERQECLDKVDEKSYDEYKKEREESEAELRKNL